MSEIIIEETNEKIKIIINHFAGIFRSQIEKDKKTNEIKAKWPYMFFIPIKRIISEPLQEVIGIPVTSSFMGKEYHRREGRFHIVLKFSSKMVLIGAVNFIRAAVLNPDFDIKQRMDYRHKHQNSVSREDISEIAKVLKVKARILDERPELDRT